MRGEKKNFYKIDFTDIVPAKFSCLVVTILEQ